MTTQNRHPSASSCHFPSSVSMKPSSERTRALTRRGPFHHRQNCESGDLSTCPPTLSVLEKIENSELPSRPIESLPAIHDRLRHNSRNGVAKFLHSKDEGLPLRPCNELRWFVSNLAGNHATHFRDCARTGTSNPSSLSPLLLRKAVKPSPRWKTLGTVLGPAPILPFRDQK